VSPLSFIHSLDDIIDIMIARSATATIGVMNMRTTIAPLSLTVGMNMNHRRLLVLSSQISERLLTTSCRQMSSPSTLIPTHTPSNITSVAAAATTITTTTTTSDASTSPLVLYGMAEGFSMWSRMAHSFLLATNTPHTYIPISLGTREQMKPDHLAINPRHKVDTIIHKQNLPSFDQLHHQHTVKCCYVLYVHVSMK
jgi:hypothetical protein